MNAIVRPSRRLAGTVSVPGDKSVSHRAALLGALADGLTEVQGFLEGEDCLGTLRAVAALGAEVARKGPGHFVIQGVRARGARASRATSSTAATPGRRCGSWSGVLAGQPFTTVLTGDESLRRRPMDRVMEPLGRMGARVVGPARRGPAAAGDRRRAAAPADPSRVAGRERPGEVGGAPGRAVRVGAGERGRARAEPRSHGADADRVRRRGPGGRRDGHRRPGPPA